MRMYWKGVHSGSGKALRLSDRRDKPGRVYFSVYLDGRQVLGLRQSDDPTVNTKFLDIMRDVVEHFARDEVRQEDLSALTDSKLKAAGLEKVQAVVRKRPAATTQGGVRKKPVRKKAAAAGDAESSSDHLYSAQLSQGSLR